ncbi:MAG: cyclase family protein [Sphingomonadales bacterium]
MKRFLQSLVFAITAWLVSGTGSAQSLDLEGFRLIDLSHAYNEKTIYWPTSPSRFELTELARGRTAAGYFYSAYSFATPEHGGTHIDAPVHFSQSGHPVDRIKLGDLIGPAVVIDISDRASRDPDYRLSVRDVTGFEQQYGRIERGAIVLLRTGWSRRWPDAKAYLGDDTPGDASHLHFPGFGADAARLLIEERGARMLGIDTASIDYGQSTDFMVHRIAAAHNVPGLENLTNLDQLPATGATIFALPIKIEGGSGGPARVIALTP